MNHKEFQKLQQSLPYEEIQKGFDLEVLCWGKIEGKGRNRRSRISKPIRDIFEDEGFFTNPQSIGGPEYTQPKLNKITQEVVRDPKQRQDRCDKCNALEEQNKNILSYQEYDQPRQRICKECRDEAKGGIIEFVRPLPRRRKRK